MPNLTQIELPSGSVYDLVDQGARDLIAAINNWEYYVCTNAADTPKDVKWTPSGGSEITGTLVASSSTMFKIYLVYSPNSTAKDSYDEYITVRTGASSSYSYSWELIGSTVTPDMNQFVKNKSGHSGDTAGDLAYKNSASGSVTVPKTYTTTITPIAKNVSVTGTTTGSVSETKSKVTVSPAASGTATYTPSGTVSKPTFSGTAATISVSGTTTGSVSVDKSKVEIKTKTSGTNSYTPAGTNAASSVSASGTMTTGVVDVKPNASGTAANKYTPAGTIGVGSGTANYTPAGSVSLKTAGSTNTIHNPTSKTVVTDMSVAAPSATQATGEMVYYEVSGTKLTLKKIVESTGASITTSDVTVKTGDAAYNFSGTGANLTFTGTDTYLKTASNVNTSSSVTVSGTAAAQTFTGTAAYLETASDVVSGASFTGASMTSTGSYTPAGGVSQPTFSGEGVRLETGSQVLTGASFTGASMTSTGSYTPATPTATTVTNETESKTVTVS